MMPLNMVKLHVPVGTSLAGALTQFVNLRTFVVDPTDPTFNLPTIQVISSSTQAGQAEQQVPVVDVSTTSGLLNADVVVIDRWDDCTRIEQQTILNQLSNLCRADVPIVLRYLTFDAFRHDGLVHQSFGQKN
jgi:hypothetical protein